MISGLIEIVTIWIILSAIVIACFVLIGFFSWVFENLINLWKRR